MFIKKTLIALWKGIINNGVHSGLGFDQVTRIRISNAVSIIGATFAFFYSLILLYNSAYSQAFNDFVFISNILLLFVFNRIRLYRVGTLFTFITVPITLILVNYEYCRIGTEYFFFAAIVLSFYYFKKTVNQILAVAFYVILILITKYLETTVEPVGIAAKVSIFAFVCNIFFSLTVLILCIWLFINEHKSNLLQIEKINSDLKIANEEISEKKESLKMVLREVNHRVKNNLQLIASLLNIQSRTVKSKTTRVALKSASDRLVSLMLVHQKLHKNDFIQKVCLKVYIKDLVEYLISSVGKKNSIEATTNVVDIMLSVEHTIHIGIVINELVTNAVKYGANPVTGFVNVDITITQSKSSLFINVSDKGPGFPNNFNCNSTNTLGMELVCSIVKQTGGDIKLYSNEGAKIEIEFKITEFSD
jgi:two-component sensor histidine kinase